MFENSFCFPIKSTILSALAFPILTFLIIIIASGLGSAIAEYKSSLKKSPKQLFLGIKDTYTKEGNYKFLQDKHRLTTEKIVEDILLNIN